MTRRLTLHLIAGMLTLAFVLAVVIGYLSYIRKEADYQNLGNQDALLGARITQYVLEKAVDNGLFDRNTLFRSHYDLVDDHGVARYRTEYDYFFDRNVVKVLKALQANSNVYYAYVINNDGYIPAHTDRAKAKTRLKLTEAGLKERPHHGTSPDWLTKSEQGYEFWEFRAPIIVEGRRWGEFRVGIPAALARDRGRGSAASTFGITIAFTLVVVGVMVYLIRSNLRPLKELTAATRQMAAGNVRARCEYAGDDELGALAQSFNAMAATISETHERLECQVRLRTAQLRESEESYRRLFADNRAIMLQIDPHDGTILAANAASVEFYGYPTERFVGMPIHEINTLPRPQILEVLAAIPQGGGNRFEFQHRLADGSLRDVEVYVTFMQCGQREICHSIIHDITDRKQGEEALRTAKEAAEAANRTKSEFLANMSHEIRTPMTAILGFADILAESVERPEEQDAIQTIKRNSNHLLGLINDILDLSKIEAGKVQIEGMPTAPLSILADVVSMMRVRADGRGLPLNLEYSSPIPEVIQSDPTRLRQILVNLVGNAIKFTENGEVNIRVCLADRNSAEPKLQCEVIDTGIGIRPEQLERLFQPFQQADASTTRKFGGTGLGLAISKRLAMLLGGDITARSAPGKGSSFTLTINTGPLQGVAMLENATEAIAQVSPHARPGEATKRRLPCRILLAEDGPDNQRLISFVLRKAGAEVEICENGKKAMEKGLSTLPGWGRRYDDSTQPFDIILMDMQMPVMDGYEATRRLRQHGYTGPILALTAHAMTDDMQKCLDAGCNAYLTKPIVREHFLNAIASFLTPPEPNAANSGAAATAEKETS
jgi:PAS domain S-box-containing protein